MRYRLNADYYQFHLHPVRLSESESEELAREIGTANLFEDHDFIQLAAIRKWGAIDVDVELLTSRPPELGPEWQDVVEFSVWAASNELRVTSWEPDDEDPTLPVTKDAAYRVRYAIKDAWNAPPADDEPGETYRVDVWPAPFARPELIWTSLPALSWHALHRARAAWEALADRGPGRTERMVELALDAYPQLPPLILAEEPSATSAVMAFVGMVQPHELTDFQLDQLILASARRRVAGG